MRGVHRWNHPFERFQADWSYKKSTRLDDAQKACSNKLAEYLDETFYVPVCFSPWRDSWPPVHSPRWGFCRGFSLFQVINSWWVVHWKLHATYRCQIETHRCNISTIWDMPPFTSLAMPKNGGFVYIYFHAVFLSRCIWDVHPPLYDTTQTSSLSLSRDWSLLVDRFKASSSAPKTWLSTPRNLTPENEGAPGPNVPLWEIPIYIPVYPHISQLSLDWKMRFQSLENYHFLRRCISFFGVFMHTLLSRLSCLSLTWVLLSRRIRHIACIRVALSTWHDMICSLPTHKASWIAARKFSNMLIGNQGQLALKAMINM